MAISFIHTADIHFGVENYGYIDFETGLHTRLLDFKKSLDTAVSFAIEKNVDCFVFAGDAYKNSHPSPTHQRMLLQSFLSLFNANIPLIIVVGNHDHSGNVFKAHSLDVFNHINHKNCYIIDKPKTITIDTKSGKLQIIGIPWPSRSGILINNNIAFTEVSNLIYEKIKEIIKMHVNNLNKELPAILIGHLTVNKGIFSGTERTAILGKDPLFEVNDLAIKPIDYVALGHLHKFQDLNKGNSPAVVYSGSIDKIDFGEAKDNKGFCYVTIKNKTETTYEFINLKTRNFIDIYFEISKLENAEKEMLLELKHYNIKDAIVRVKYICHDKKTIEVSLINRVLKEVFYIANIKCDNDILISKKERFYVNTNESIESMISSYIQRSKTYSVDYNEYVNLIKEYFSIELN